MANLSWARNAVMEAAVRELVFEARQGAATDPSNCPEKRGVFSPASRRSDFNAADHAEPPADKWRCRLMHGTKPPRKKIYPTRSEKCRPVRISILKLSLNNLSRYKWRHSLPDSHGDADLVRRAKAGDRKASDQLAKTITV